MRFCSPLKVVKSLAIVAVIVISLYFYLTLRWSSQDGQWSMGRWSREQVPRWSRRKYYARHYSGNTTVISHLLYNSREIQDKKISNTSLALLNIAQLKQAKNFEDGINKNQKDKVTYLFLTKVRFSFVNIKFSNP